MPEDNKSLIGLTELIDQVKRDLMATTLDQNSEVPLLCVDAIELELQVTVKKEGKGGIKIYVADATVGASRDEVQRVKVSLSPLLSKEQLLKIYYGRFPKKWKEFLEMSSDALLKGDEDPGI